MPISNDFIEQAYNGGGNPLIALLRVNVDGSYYYYCDNTESIQSNVSGSSQAYQSGYFKLDLPDNSTEGEPTATLTFDAADIQMIRRLREADNRLQFDMWLVLGSDPNVVEFGPANYESETFSISSQRVSVGLIVEPDLNLQLPKDKFTPKLFPGLWSNP